MSRPADEATHVIVPSLLVDALTRVAAQETRNRQQEQSTRKQLKNPIGLLLGTKEFHAPTPAQAADPVDEAQPHQVAIWSLIRALEAYDELEASLPGGISPVGYLVLDFDSETPEQLAQKAQETLQNQSFLGYEWRVVLVFAAKDQNLHWFQGVQREQGLPVAATIVDCFHAQDFHKHLQFVPVRCRFQVSIPLDEAAIQQTRGNADSNGDVVEQMVQQVKDQLTSRKSSCYFMKFPYSDGIFRLDGINMLNPKASMPTLQQVFEPQQTSKNKKKKKGSKTKKKSKPSSAADQVAAVLDAIDQDQTTDEQSQEDVDPRFESLDTIEYGSIRQVALLQTLDPVQKKSSQDRTVCAPWVDFQEPLTSSIQNVHLHCDVLAFERLSASVSQIIQTLMRQLCLQLDAFVMKHAGNSMNRHWFCDHFSLVGMAHPLTRVQVESSDPKRAQSERLELHQTLLQPLQRPLFLPNCTLGNQHQQLTELKPVLLNIHEAMVSTTNSGVTNGKKFLVQGAYGYFHYLQDGINDKGWGCAYRSLQTLASWFYLNNYTDLARLSHTKIQQTLVKIGDKQANFVDSREWIGSMEVGFVLDELFDVSFRSLNAPNGAALAGLARELAQHFESQGTPVMMGGGQLAFTILGIDWNDQSGEMALLILDPHYVGEEDVTKITTQTVQLEGYKAIPCSWRKPSSFAKDSFYNLCLPQCPHAV